MDAALLDRVILRSWKTRRRWTKIANLGGIGEATLTAWAHEVGISPTRSTDDVKGWDYVLVLPKPAAAGHPATPLDEEPPEFTCLVQVKATRDASKPIKTKLSNGQRLATAPLPAFFFVVEIDPSNKPSRAFVVHVGEEWITRVLKRLREVPSTGPADLHRRFLSLTVNADDALPIMNGRALLASLRGHAGKNAFQYVKAKEQWLETVGYDERPYRVTVTFTDDPDDEFFDAASDVAIGERKRLPAKRYRVRKTRLAFRRRLGMWRFPSSLNCQTFLRGRT